jgi:hypothetical protein
MNEEELAEMINQIKANTNAYLKEHGEENSRLAEEAIASTPAETDAPRMHDSSGFPDEPVNPTALASKVTEKLNSFPNFVTPEKTPIMVEELCRSFNECIRLNKAGETQTLILSPKTGSAKSVSSKMYVSQLKEHASIIVVFTIEDALQTCKDINEWSGDDSYARCTYTPTKENPEDKFWVDRYKLKKYRCIVISHALFIRLNDKEDINLLSRFSGRKREFVLIDERIDLYKEVTFPLTNLKLLSKLFNDIKHSLQLPLVDSEIEYLKTLEEIFKSIADKKEITLDIKDGEAVVTVDSKNFIAFNKKLKESEEIDVHDFKNFYKQLDEGVIKLRKIIDPLYLLGDSFNEDKIKSTLKAMLNDLSIILKNNFYYFAQLNNGQSPVIMVTRNILNGFGSSVVLDATATVNALYNDKVSENQGTVKHISTTNPRRYENCTIYKCKGVPQGKSSIYDTLAPQELQTVLNLYKDIADSILSHKDDKLLIISHQKFGEKLKTKIRKKRIEFTYWGNHRGKNKWSHCNKVFVIGWNYVPAEVHYRNYINAINGTHDINNERLKEIKQHYEMTQIADDLVQGVNRGAVRTTASTDGNCTKSEIYMFYPNSEFGLNLMEGFEDEFDGATVIPWSPVGIEKIQKLAKSYANIETVVAYIERQVKQHGEIQQSQVQKYFDDQANPERLSGGEDRMPKSTVANALLHTECKLLLETKGIYRVSINDKSYKFTNNPIDIY